AQFLGRVEESRGLVDRALAILDAIPEPPSEIATEVLAEAARIRVEQGDDEGAGRLIDRASRAADAVAGGHEHDAARMLVEATRGLVHRARGRFVDAEIALKAALDAAE